MGDTSSLDYSSDGRVNVGLDWTTGSFQSPLSLLVLAVMFREGRCQRRFGACSTWHARISVWGPPNSSI